MDLVTTKPGLIVAASDRELEEATVEMYRTRRKDFKRCFVELGSGSGMHLLKLAESNPDVLCIGFEMRFKRAFKTGEKAEGFEMPNVLVLRTNANLLSKIVEPQSLHGVFINYPDPWAKRRWKKNRLLNKQMINEIHASLINDGFFRFKTDHHEYFDSILPLLSTPAWTQTKCTHDLENSTWRDETITSEFEMLFKSQKKPLCFVEAVRI